MYLLWLKNEISRHDIQNINMTNSTELKFIAEYGNDSLLVWLCFQHLHYPFDPLVTKFIQNFKWITK